MCVYYVYTVLVTQAGGVKHPLRSALNPLIVQEGYGEPLVPWVNSNMLFDPVK